MSERALESDGYCFGCGPRNPIGLGLTFDWDGAVCTIRWIPEKEHQGWAGRVHGGLLALVLDEAMSHAVLEAYGLYWVTAELKTRLRAPARIGETLRITARIESARTRLITCSGEVRTEAGGQLAATGSAKMMRAGLA